MRAPPCERCGATVRLVHGGDETSCIACGAIRYSIKPDMVSRLEQMNDEIARGVGRMEERERPGTKTFEKKRLARARREAAVKMYLDGASLEEVLGAFDIGRSTFVEWRRQWVDGEIGPAARENGGLPEKP